MMNNGTEWLERIGSERLMTRPTRKSVSAKGADVLVIRASLGRQGRGRVDNAERAFLGHEEMFGTARADKHAAGGN
jgi:hypothetical protein